MEIQSAFAPRQRPIDGNAILAMMQAQKEALPQNYGRIANRSTGQVVEKIGNAPITEDPSRVAKETGVAKGGFKSQGRTVPASEAVQ